MKNYTLKPFLFSFVYYACNLINETNTKNHARSTRPAVE